MVAREALNFKILGSIPDEEAKFRRKMKEKTYIVTVLRTGYAHRDIEVSATSETEARTKAEDMAGNYEFSEHSSEYETQEVEIRRKKDEIDLEEGIKKFEEGSKIVKDLKEYLDKMENRIKELKK